MRKNDKCLEKDPRYYTGWPPKQGRPKTSRLGNIGLWTGLTMEELLRTVECRQLQRKIVVAYMMRSTLEPTMTKKRTSVYNSKRIRMIHVYCRKHAQFYTMNIFKWIISLFETCFISKMIDQHGFYRGLEALWRGGLKIGQERRGKDR